MEATDLEQLWAQFSTALDLEHTMSPIVPVEESLPASPSTNGCVCIGDDRDILQDGFVVCSLCGVAKDVQIDTGAEWRNFTTLTSTGSSDTTQIRCGDPANALMPGTQLNTYIGKGGNARQQRVHQWYNISSKERSLYQIFKEYEQIVSNHHIGRDLAFYATELYRKLQDEMESRNAGVKRCNVRQGLKAACLYYACKKLQSPRERKEIADMFDTTTKIVTRGCNTFLDVMGDEFVVMKPLGPLDFLGRFCRSLGIPYSEELRIGEIVSSVAQLDAFSDSTPTSIACGCIYYHASESNRKISKSDIKDKCGSSQAIITKIYNKLVAVKHLLPLLDREKILSSSTDIDHVHRLP